VNVEDSTKGAVVEQAEPAEPAEMGVGAVKEQAAEPAGGRQVAAAAEPNEAGEQEVEYYAVFLQGKKVGYAVERRQVSGERVKTSERVRMTISRVGVPVTVEMAETAIETTEGEPIGFESVQQLGAMAMRVRGVVEPNGLVRVTSESVGSVQQKVMRWPEGALMAEGLRLFAKKQGLVEGRKYRLKLFSPGLCDALDTEISIGPVKEVDLLGRVVLLREVTSRYTMPGAGPIESVGYVDDQFRMLKYRMPVAGLQVEVVSCTKEFALGANDVLELVDRMFVSSPRPLGDVGSARAITYHLRAVGSEGFDVPEGDNQRVRRLDDGTMVVTVRPVRASGGEFPYRGSDERLLEALRPSRFLQSDLPVIRDLAKEAVGDARDASEAVRRIEEFVGRYVRRRDLSVGYASAAEVAASRQGDCSEFAVLTAALCRAVGIPAEVVVGIAYVEDFAGRSGFGGHAWVRAYIGEPTRKWVGLDAAFRGSGRGGYDAGHIALAWGDGEPSDFFNMATALGRFRIEQVVVEDRR